MKRLVAISALGVFMAAGLLLAQDKSTYTVVVKGAM